MIGLADLNDLTREARVDADHFTEWCKAQGVDEESLRAWFDVFESAGYHSPTVIAGFLVGYRLAVRQQGERLGL